MKKFFLLIFVIGLSFDGHAQTKKGTKAQKPSPAKTSVKKPAVVVNKNTQNSHRCNYCGITFYGKGYYLSYSSNGLEMQRSDNENQELCCSSKCANAIMDF